MNILRLSFFIFILGCTTSKVYKTSDHYNPSTKEFFNPNSEPADKSIFQMLQWKLFTSAAEWPKHRELKNKPIITNKLKVNETNITFINHSTFLIQFKDTNILTDPVWSERVSPVTWIGPKRVHKPGVKFENLPKIDLVLISHNHYDHMDFDTLSRLEEKFSPTFIVPLGDKDKLEKLGLTKVFELDWWENLAFNEVEIFFTPSKHWSKRSLFDRNESLWGSFIIQNNGKNIYFAGDTGYSPHFKDVPKRFGSISLSLLPIGAYAPRWFMQSMHMDPEEAIWAHKDLKSKQSIGMHFGTFQLTNEPIDEPQHKLKMYLRSNEVKPNNFDTLSAGESQIIKLQ